MSTKHYYAMHTPHGNVVDSNGTPIGYVLMFDRKRERDEWVSENYHRDGKPHQAEKISEHDARVTMLRQYGRKLFEAHESDQFKVSCYTYREYAQFYPTPLMHDNYETALSNRD